MYLKKLNDLIFRISGVVATVLMGAIVALTFAQVTCRYFIHYSITWSTEITVYILIWMIFLSCSMGYRGGKICALTLLTDRLPPRIQCGVTIVAQLLMIGFFGLTFIGNIEIVELAWAKVSSILSIPMRYVYSAWSIAAVIMTLYALEIIWNAIKGMTAAKEAAQ